MVHSLGFLYVYAYYTLIEWHATSISPYYAIESLLSVQFAYDLYVSNRTVVREFCSVYRLCDVCDCIFCTLARVTVRVSSYASFLGVVFRHDEVTVPPRTSASVDDHSP